MTDNKKTEELNDSELDKVEGGIGLLLPAVQKVREAAAKDDGSSSASFTGGVRVAAGDVNGDAAEEPGIKGVVAPTKSV